MKPVAVLAAASVLLALTGCESTVDAARKIAARGTLAFAAKGLTVARIDRRIRILSTAIVHDPNGTAAVVVLRNTGPKPIINAPIAITVLDQAGRSLYANNAAGAEYDLAHVPSLPAGKQIDWVNDQVLPGGGTPVRMTARVGAGATPHGSLPKLETSSVALSDDPASGWVASGQVHNASHIDQVHLVVFATGRRGGRIVSAGRAIVARLPAGKTAVFHAYLIGNPRNAQISVSVPPSVIT